MGKTLYLAIIACLALVVAGCVMQPQTPTGNITGPGAGSITIGVIAPLSGDMAAYGQYGKEAIDLAVDEINSMGGVNGRAIRLAYEDDKVDPKTSATAAEKLATVDRVDAVLYFSGSGATLAGAPALERNSVPTVVGLASNPAIRDAGNYIFRVIPSDSFQGRQWVDMAGEFGYSRPAVLFVNNAWGSGVKDAFLESYEGDALVEAMEEGATDVKSQLLKIGEYNPDVLFLTCYIMDCITTARQMKETGLSWPVIAGDVFYNQEILDAVGTAADGFLVTRASEGSGREWQEFRERFIQRYSKEPNHNHAFAYDSAYTLYYALQRAGTEKEALKDALYKTDFVGPSGRNRFDGFGEVSKPFAVELVQNGEFVKYTP